MKQYNIKMREERQFLARLRDIHKLFSFQIQVDTPSNRFFKKEHHIKRILVKILKEQKLQTADRDDVLQNCYLYLYRKICKGQMPKNLSNSLHQRIRRAIIRIRRHHHRWCTGRNLDRCVRKESSTLTSNQIDEIRVRKILPDLPSHMKTVITRRFGLDGYNTETLKEIGIRLHLTSERVRQIELQGIMMLRMMMLENEEDRMEKHTLIMEKQQTTTDTYKGKYACLNRAQEKHEITLRLGRPYTPRHIGASGDGGALYIFYRQLCSLVRKTTPKGNMRKAIVEEMERLTSSRANRGRVFATT